MLLSFVIVHQNLKFQEQGGFDIISKNLGIIVGGPVLCLL